MINALRQLIQEKLMSIPELEAGEIIGDELIEEGKYYFGYKLSISGNRYSMDYSNLSQYISITGYLSTKNSSLSNMDKFTDAIMNNLAKLRFMCTCDDISTLDTKVRKILITGTVKYDYLDGLLK